MVEKQEIIYAFIDSQNLNLGTLKDITRNGVPIYKGWKLDFKKFYIYLKAKYHVSKTFLFIGKITGPSYEALYNYLAKIGYQVEFKPTMQYIDDDNKPQTKGNVDAELVLHTMIEYNNYDKAIIVAGDGDYFCLIEYLEKNHKLLHLMIPNKLQWSSLLKDYGKYMVFVTDLKAHLK
jgi:uncharacterized LabA/DUF88 family protein